MYIKENVTYMSRNVGAVVLHFAMIVGDPEVQIVGDPEVQIVTDGVPTNLDILRFVVTVV